MLIDKLLYGVNKFNKKDKKVTALTLQFLLPTYEKLKENELNSLTTTAQDLFHMLAEFAKYKNTKNEMRLTLVDDQL